MAALEHLKPRTNAGPVSWTGLKSATVRGPDLSTYQTQTFVHDVYGNLTSTSGLGQTVSLPVNDSTNRLLGIDYGAAGNLSSFGIQHFEYDALGMPNAVRLGSDTRPRMTLRGFDNKVLRDSDRAAMSGPLTEITSTGMACHWRP